MVFSKQFLKILITQIVNLAKLQLCVYVVSDFYIATTSSICLFMHVNLYLPFNIVYTSINHFVF